MSTHPRPSRNIGLLVGVASSVILLLTIACYVGFQLLDAPNSDQWTELEIAIQERRWDDALALQPDSAEALVGRAVEKLCQEPPDLTGAKSDLLLARESGASMEEVDQLLRRSVRAASASDPDKAFQALYEARKLTSNKSNLNSARAAAAIQAGAQAMKLQDYELAITSLDEAIAWDPSVTGLSDLALSLARARLASFEKAPTPTNDLAFKRSFDRVSQVDPSAANELLQRIAELPPRAINRMTPDMIARLPPNLLAKLPPEVQTKLPADLLANLPSHVFAKMTPDLLVTLPSEVLAKLPSDVISKLTPNMIAKLQSEVLAKLPLDVISKLTPNMIANLPPDYLARLPSDFLATLPTEFSAKLPLEVLEKLPPHVSAQLIPRLPVYKNSIGMKLKPLLGGTFMMGSTSDGNSARKVKLTQPFSLGVYEVTQEQYERVMGTNPSRHKHPQKPVEMVSYLDAVEFCQQLTALAEEQAAGRVYRLPTEAEWEYACRAGTTTAYEFGDSESDLDDYGWYKGNAAKTSHQVGRKRPNGWGLFDMHGNVWEWCHDRYGDYPDHDETDPTGPTSGSEVVDRGGSWYGEARGCSSFARNRRFLSSRYGNIGVRVACSQKSLIAPSEAYIAVDLSLTSDARRAALADIGDADRASKVHQESLFSYLPSNLQECLVSGDAAWNDEGGITLQHRKAESLLEIPVSLPEEYQLEIAVRRKSAGGAFVVCIPHRGYSTALVIDGSGGSGISDINGQTYRNNPTRVDGTRFADRRVHSIQVFSTPKGLFVNWDGKTLTEFTGPPKQLTIEKWSLHPNPLFPALKTTRRGHFVIERALIHSKDPLPPSPPMKDARN